MRIHQEDSMATPIRINDKDEIIKEQCNTIRNYENSLVKIYSYAKSIEDENIKNNIIKLIWLENMEVE